MTEVSTPKFIRRRVRVTAPDGTVEVRDSELNVADVWFMAAETDLLETQASPIRIPAGQGELLNGRLPMATSMLIGNVKVRLEARTSDGRTFVEEASVDLDAIAPPLNQ